ncbi:hypothetical protein M405DRAFT_829044 [Rhizopogon salebrosus TDB-379]|nr:hypothetical protein M405DRAFT_829044 [Rhizopogon salebrosus TDB-379]
MSTLSRGLVPADMVSQTSSELRTSSAKDAPRPSMDTSLFRYWGEKARIESV